MVSLFRKDKLGVGIWDLQWLVTHLNTLLSLSSTVLKKQTLKMGIDSAGDIFDPQLFMALAKIVAYVLLLQSEVGCITLGWWTLKSCTKSTSQLLSHLKAKEGGLVRYAFGPWASARHGCWKTLESPLGPMEVKPVNPKVNLNIHWKDWLLKLGSSTGHQWPKAKCERAMLEKAHDAGKDWGQGRIRRQRMECWMFILHDSSGHGFGDKLLETVRNREAWCCSAGSRNWFEI